MRPDQEGWSNRRFSKRITLAAIIWGMAMPLLAMFLKPDLFAAAMAGGVSTILAALGGYQTIGHADMRASLRSANNGYELPGGPHGPAG